jgi:hypothetical protein
LLSNMIVIFGLASAVFTQRKKGEKKLKPLSKKERGQEDAI